MREGGCWPKRPIAVLTVRMSAPKSLQFSVFFSSGSGAGRGGDLFRQGAGRGNFFVREREGGCWPKRPKAPCVYRIPPGPHVLCGHSREFCEKRGFRKSPLRGGGRPGRQHTPRYPLPPPLSLDEEGEGLYGARQCPGAREAWGLTVEIKKARKNGPFYCNKFLSNTQFGFPRRARRAIIPLSHSEKSNKMPCFGQVFPFPQ